MQASGAIAAGLALLLPACGKDILLGGATDAADDGDAPACACDQDVHPDDGDVVLINVLDENDVKNCYTDVACTAGTRADVNCDAAVDACDLDLVRASLFGAPDPGVCRRERCGACVYDDGSCVVRAETPCRVAVPGGGTWLGQGAPCP